MADVTPRRNGSNEVTNNYNSNVVDAVGVQILPPVKTFGARGLDTAKWSYDKNGLIVENGWSAKIDLYKIINDATKPTSVRVEAIDKRVMALVTDAKTYMLAAQGYAEGQKEIDELYASIPVIFGLGLKQAGAPLIPNIFAQAVGILAKTQKPETYKMIMQQLQKKLIHLEAEVKGLEVLKNNLTGVYASFDKVIDPDGRSAKLDTNTWVLIAVIVVIVYLFIKKRFKR